MDEKCKLKVKIKLENTGRELRKLCYPNLSFSPTSIVKTSKWSSFLLYNKIFIYVKLNYNTFKQHQNHVNSPVKGTDPLARVWARAIAFHPDFWRINPSRNYSQTPVTVDTPSQGLNRPPTPEQPSISICPEPDISDPHVCSLGCGRIEISRFGGGLKRIHTKGDGPGFIEYSFSGRIVSARVFIRLYALSNPKQL